MHRKQISAMETFPLNALDDRAGTNDNRDNDSPSVTPSISNKSKKKRQYDEYDDEDGQPVKLSFKPRNRILSEQEFGLCERRMYTLHVVDDKVTDGWDLLMYYAKNSTMHGIPTIVGSELYRGRHIFWTCVVCVMAILLGSVVYLQMRHYYDYPTVTSMDIRYVDENDFPAVTLCNLNYFDAVLVKAHLDNYTAYHLTRLTEIAGLYHKYGSRFLNKTAPTLTHNRTEEEILELLNKTIGRVETMPLHCSWGNYYWSRCPASKPQITEMGVCVTIDVRKLAKKISEKETSKGDKDAMPAIGNALRGLTLYADVSPIEINYRIYQFNGYKAVLHAPEDEPLPLSSGFLMEGDTTVEVEISKTVKMGLPYPYKAFGSGSCVETQSNSFQNFLKRFQNYSKEVCEAECFIDYVVEACGGCKHFLHPGKERLCPLDHLADCYRNAEKSYYGGRDIGGKSRRECKCPMPCTQAMYQASVTSSPFKQTKFFTDIQLKFLNKTLNTTLIYVHFFFSDPVVSEMRQVAVYSAEGLLGNIGGQIGLFMGFSLVTVAEMLELIFLLVTRGRNLDERVKRHKNSEAAAQAALQA